MPDARIKDSISYRFADNIFFTSYSGYDPWRGLSELGWSVFHDAQEIAAARERAPAS